MNIHENITLKNFTTMKLGGNAKYMAEVRTNEEVQNACKDAKSKNLPIFVIGGGSNVIAHDEGYVGLIIRMRIPGFEIINEDNDSTTIKIGAGENWDLVVKRTVDMKLSGIEAMSAIPGTAGAAPVQNVGAYGQDISNTLQSLTAYDMNEDKFVTVYAKECGFSYRNSIFKTALFGQFVITSITIKLSKQNAKPPFYDSLQKYLDNFGINEYTPLIIRNAVIEIRKNKLPDPSIVANCGSFFKNAIVDSTQINDLKQIDQNIPSYDMKDGNYKIPAGWLIEQSGLKGQLIHGMRIYDKNALVLINESAKSYSDLDMARNEIINKVKEKFNIIIEQEPIEII